MIDVNSTGIIEFVVDEASTAIALGSGDVPVLGTPKVVALIEQASIAAIGAQIEQESTTVGTKVMIRHLSPTKVGATVRAEAVVEDVRNGRITIAVKVTEGNTLVAEGSHVRVVVDRDRFMG
ncbi:MAG: thioesterase [Actinomycetota bacterium]|nr:thioesterase [Actinomycetota bacterium]